MSKTEILEELPKLTPEERHEIRLKLAELDGDDWLDADDQLSDKEKRCSKPASRILISTRRNQFPGLRPKRG